MSDGLSQTNFLKVSMNDGKECIVNEKFIRFITRNNSCFYICTKMDGCDNSNMLKVCKNDFHDTWKNINKYFE